MKKSLMNLAVATASIKSDYTLPLPINQYYRGKGHNKQAHKNNYKKKRGKR